jgi:ubiquinone/menaquinone biosynthesis C-methylase UbiE
MGRVIAPPMHFSGAGWLVRAERNREEQPAKLLKALELKEGQVVCDFGCGNGFYTLELAKRVGPRGTVHAVDIQAEMLELLADRAGPRGLDNVRTVLATDRNSGLPPGTFDLVLMVDVYHELADPAAILKAVHESLKPSGRLAVVEFREEDPGVPILPLHKMSQAQVAREVSTGGFKMVRQFDGLPWQHVLFFARGDSPLEIHELQPWKRSP